MMIAVHPENADSIIKALDEPRSENDYAAALTEEELETAASDYERTSLDDIEATIAALRQFGLKVES